MITLPTYNQQGKEAGKIELDRDIFDGKISEASIYQAVVIYQANKRAGCASTKTKAEVRGGGCKPWRQKGTGRARVGSIRSPLWRHGGVVFGPHPRSYKRHLPKSIKALALKSSLNSKLNEKCVFIVDKIELNTHKTGELSKILKRLKIEESVLLVVDSIGKNLKRASQNIPFVKVMLAAELNAYEVLRYKKLVFTKEGMQAFINRLKATPACGRQG